MLHKFASDSFNLWKVLWRVIITADTAISSIFTEIIKSHKQHLLFLKLKLVACYNAQSEHNNKACSHGNELLSELNNHYVVE